jgi:hypothetical protein
MHLFHKDPIESKILNVLRKHCNICEVELFEATRIQESRFKQGLKSLENKKLIELNWHPHENRIFINLTGKAFGFSKSSRRKRRVNISKEVSPTASFSHDQGSIDSTSIQGFSMSPDKGHFPESQASDNYLDKYLSKKLLLLLEHQTYTSEQMLILLEEPHSSIQNAIRRLLGRGYIQAVNNRTGNRVSQEFAKDNIVDSHLAFKLTFKGFFNIHRIVYS